MHQKIKDFNYQILGQDTSPKFVFLHGIMGQGRNWQSIAKRFSRHFQCLILDQRGHGSSFHPDGASDLKDFVDDLEFILGELGWTEPIHLLGHSMGGRVALLFADRHPEWVDKLVIVDIGPESDWQSMAGILEKVDFVPVPFENRQEARDFMEGPFLQKFPNPMVMEFFYANLVERDGQVDWTFSKPMVRQVLEQSRHRDYWANFKELAMPTLLIRGEKSPDFPQEAFKRVVENNPNIKGVEIEGAGHWVHAEKPQETIRIIEEFFNIAGASNQ